LLKEITSSSLEEELAVGIEGYSQVKVRDAFCSKKFKDFAKQ
jgi:hypothetical protein